MVKRAVVNTMLIWGFCRLDKGYTLLELLIVLLIISLVTALIMPRLFNMYSRWQAAYERDDVFARVGSLGYLAFQRGIDFDLTRWPAATGEQIPLELPVGWSLTTQAPIHFFANGACSGGTVFLHYQAQSFQLTLQPPFCRPEIL